MKNPLCSGVKRVRQATACAVIVACLMPLPASAQARSAEGAALVQLPGVLFSPTEPANGPATSHLRRSLANLHDQLITSADRRVTPDAQRSYRGRRGRRDSGDRAMMGLVLGAIGGLVVGGVIGAQVSANSCRCSNPELHGFIIGAPIGAVVGGFLGYALAR
jgi:Glycine zipper 2TM domain